MKKILKNKIVYYILLFLTIYVMLLLLFFNLKYFIIFCISIIFIFHILLKNLFDINLINYNKIIALIGCTIKNRSNEKDEIYLKKLKIKTFDGSGSITHPSTLYFEEGFNGYKFWMVFTPYDNNNVELENPCICVSNDGINFFEIDGLKNPLLPIIKRKNINTFYNDPFLLYTDKLEIWYRYTIEGKKLINDVYRITSKDGINWSKPELMIKSDDFCYMSLSIVCIKNKYYMYFFDMNYNFYSIESEDLKNWSKPVLQNVNGFDGNFWHGEVKVIKNKLYLLFMSKEYELYMAKKELNDSSFTLIKKYKFKYYDKKNIYGEVVLYKSSFIFLDDYMYYYIPFRIKYLNSLKIGNLYRRKWTLTLTKEKYYVEEDII